MKTTFLALLIILYTGFSVESADIYSELTEEKARIERNYPDADRYWGDNLGYLQSYLESYELYRLNFLLRSINSQEFDELYYEGFMDHLIFFTAGIKRYEKDEVKIIDFLIENPKLALYSFPFYADQLYAEKAFTILCDVIPQDVLKKRDLWMDTEIALPVIDKLVASSPKLLARHMNDDAIKNLLKASESELSKTFKELYELSGHLSNTFLLLDQSMPPHNLSFKEIYQISSNSEALSSKMVYNFLNGSYSQHSISEELKNRSQTILEKRDTFSWDKYFISYLIENDKLSLEENMFHLNILRNSGKQFKVNFKNQFMLTALFSTMDLMGQFGYYNLFNQIIMPRYRIQLETIYLANRNRNRIPYEIFDRSFSDENGSNGLRFRERDRFILHLKRNIDASFKTLKYIKKDPIARQFLDQVCAENPYYILSKFEYFSREPYALRFLERAVLEDPAAAKEFLSSGNSELRPYLKRCRNPKVSKLLQLHDKFGMLSNSYLLADLYLNNTIEADDAHTTGFYKDLLFKKLVDLRPVAVYGKQSIDKHLANYVLSKIRELNARIDLPAESSDDIGDFSATELYFYMIYGEEELLSNTFGKFYPKFSLKLSQNKEEFISSFKYFKIGQFLKVCSHHMVLDDFLGHFSSAERKTMIDHIFNKELDLENFVKIAELFTAIDDSKFKSELQKKIELQMEAALNKENANQFIMLSMLKSLQNDTLKNIDPKFSSLKHDDLEENGILSEWQFFYNDSDGQLSYDEFLKMYRSNQNWIVEDNKHFTRVYTVSGNPIEILSNKPSSVSEGYQGVREYLKSNMRKAKVVIHRGYSFHVEKTIQHINEDALLVFLGSCGGYYKVDEVMEKSPAAQVISTRQVATHTLNNPLIYKINEELRTNEKIDWKEFWKQTQTELKNKRINDYIAPHKNFSHRLINSYFDVLGI